MSDPAIIQGALVNVRNVGTHKSVALTIHVPEELGQRIIELFGWPTMVKPVPVFVARQEIGGGKPDSPPPLDAGEDHSSRASPAVPVEKRISAGLRDVMLTPGIAPRTVSEMPVASQIALACRTELFQQWIRTKWAVPVHNDEAAEEWVKHMAGVERKRDVSSAWWWRTHRKFEEWTKTLGMPKP